MYFGRDREKALEKYNQQKDVLHAGRKPKEVGEFVAVKGVVNALLATKLASVEAGELSPRTFEKYKTVCDLIVAKFTKQREAADPDADDFPDLRAVMSSRWGSLRLRDCIQAVRSVFKHAYEKGLLTTPMRFGPDALGQQVIQYGGVHGLY